MHEEDLAMQEYNRKERQLYLRERWAMADEEKLMRDYLRAEALKLVRSKYDVVGEEPEEKSQKTMRREEIKKMVADRQRAKRETALMRKEDALSEDLRQNYLRALYDLMLEEERGHLEEENDEEYQANAAAAKEEAQARAKRREKQRQKRKKEEAERAIARELNAAFLESLLAEHEVFQAEEDLRKFSVLTARTKQLSLKSDLYMRGAIDDKLKARRKVVQMRKRSEAASKQLVELVAAVDEFRPKARKAAQDMILVKRESEYMNSDVIHGMDQRFCTDKLLGELHHHFFYLLSCQIGTTAEIISLERQLRETVLEIQSKVDTISLKNAELRKIELRWRRASWLRLRRSELGKYLFGHSREVALKNAFLAWQEISSWQGTTRRAFQVKIGVAQNHAALKQVEKQRYAEASEEVQVNQIEGTRRQTIMERHTHRLLTCKHCKHEFTEVTNTSRACPYHPGVYHLACPRTCRRNKHRTDGSVDKRCATHYRKRWSCCDDPKAVAHGLDGCHLRWHIANQDERYQELLSKVQAAAQEKEKRSNALNGLVQKFRSKAKVVRFHNLEAIRKGLIEERKVVAEHDNLKFYV